MECRRAEELILTDYVDGVLEGPALAEIESHIGSCPACRALAEEAASASRVLKAAGLQEAPAGLWEKIRIEIDTGGARRRFAQGLLERARFSLAHLRPAAVMAGAVAILLVVTAIFLDPPQEYLPEEDDILAISYVNGNGNGNGYDLGTATEEFFL